MCKKIIKSYSVDPEDFLCERNDNIDNAFHKALETLADASLEWDMFLIGSLMMSAEKLLETKGIKFCHPSIDEDETVCCISKERCKHCTFS